MLVVISKEELFPGEAEKIKALFEAGLEVFHLRKRAPADDFRRLIASIDPVFHPQIALHEHHELAGDFDIKRLHFPEAERNAMKTIELEELQKEGYVLSTSVHTMEMYEKLPSCFSYTFFGPVFDSISKEGYRAVVPAGFEFQLKNKSVEVIGLGGLDASNMGHVQRMKFDGAALLGAIWSIPPDPVAAFKTIQSAWKQ